jgi:hypothetical protein
VNARPILSSFDELFLDRLRQDVLQDTRLGKLLVGDDGHVVAPPEDRSFPAGEAIDLQSQLGVEVAHEVGHLLGVVDDQEEVEMGGEHRDRVDCDLAVALGLPERAQEEVVELWTGKEQVSSLDGPAGDVDEGVGLGDVANFSGHTL